MKILFLSHNFYPYIGGIEVNSDILSKAFFDAGHDVKVLTWTIEYGEKAYPFPIVRNPSIKQLFKLHKWADLVFENNPCLRLAWPNILFKHPNVIALNTWVSRIDNKIGMHGKIGFQDRLKFWWFRHSSAVIAVSDAIRKHSYPPATVIGNPYQSDIFKRIPNIDKDLMFVFLGRLVPNKGADQAIIAIKQLIAADQKKQFLTFRLTLTIIGDGPEKQKLEQLAIDHKVQDYVTFTGSLRGNKLAECLNRHQYILVPSLWEEPFGNVALEGMACGCLPIVSDGGGLPDAIGHAGLSFKRGNTDDLVSTIENLLANPDTEYQLRSAAQNHLKSHESAVVSQRYLQIVEQAAKAVK